MVEPQQANGRDAMQGEYAEARPGTPAAEVGEIGQLPELGLGRRHVDPQVRTQDSPHVRFQIEHTTCLDGQQIVRHPRGSAIAVDRVMRTDSKQCLLLRSGRPGRNRA